jgi:hypothetical protein
MPTRAAIAETPDIIPPQGAPASLFKGVRHDRNSEVAKFQTILDWYNDRGPTKETGLAGVDLYIYRSFPKIDAKKGGREFTYVEKLIGVNENGDVTEMPRNLRDYIKAHHGGGRYRCSLNDKSREGYTQVALTQVKIDELEVDPILNMRELVTTDPETQTWIQRQLSIGRLARDQAGELILPSEKETAPRSDNDLALKLATAALNRQNDPAMDHASKRSIDLITDTTNKLLDRAHGVDPMAQTKMLVETIAALNKGDNSMAIFVPLLQTMMTTQAQAQQANMTLMLGLIEKRNAPPAASETDPTITNMERLMGFANKFAGGGKTNWADEIKGLLPSLLPIFLAMRMNPQQANAAAGNMIGRQPPPGGHIMDTGAGAITVDGAPGALLRPDQIEDLATKAYACMQREQDGDDFAAAVECIYSPAIYTSIRSIGRDALIAGLLQSQHGQQFQAIGPVFVKFIDDFFAYGELEREPDGSPSPEPPPAGAV